MKKSLVSLILLGMFCVLATAQTTRLVVADFNKGQPTNLGEEFGTWDKDANDSTQSCKMSFAKDDVFSEKDGQSLQLDYDVDSPNPAYNGFWLKISQAQAADYDTLIFYVKGDPEKGFTSKIKLEIKDKKKGKATFLIENITDKWQKISLTLDKRSFAENQSKPLEEFVIVFDDLNSSPKTGRLLLDQIEFFKSI
jgi:hypothetical protein